MKKHWLCAVMLAAFGTGCGTTLPEHDALMAWVDVTGRAGYTLSAQRLDGEKVADARYFQVFPGQHQLELRLGYERKGSAVGAQRTHCRVIFDYDSFTAGERYSVYAVATGFTVRAWLRDRAGKRLQESGSIRCGSQY